jgi:hypothetical protein
MLKSATVQNVRFSINRKRQRRGEKEDCCVRVPERRAQGNDAGQHDFWMHCAVALTRVRWFSPQDDFHKQLKLMFGSRQRLIAVQTKLGNIMFNEGRWEFEDERSCIDVDIVSCRRYCVLTWKASWCSSPEWSHLFVV